MLHRLCDSDSPRGREEGEGVFWRGCDGAQTGQNSQGFIMSGGKDSIQVGPNLAVADVKLVFIISRILKIRSYVSLAMRF